MHGIAVSVASSTMRVRREIWVLLGLSAILLALVGLMLLASPPLAKPTTPPTIAPDTTPDPLQPQCMPCPPRRIEPLRVAELE